MYKKSLFLLLAGALALTLPRIAVASTWSFRLNVTRFDQNFAASEIRPNRVSFDQYGGDQIIDFTIRLGNGTPLSDQIHTQTAPGATCPGHARLIVSRENGRYYIELDYAAVYLGHWSDGSVMEAGHENYTFKGEALLTEGNWDAWLAGAPASFAWTEESLARLFPIKAAATRDGFVEVLNFDLRKAGRREVTPNQSFDSADLQRRESYSGTIRDFLVQGLLYDLRFRGRD